MSRVLQLFTSRTPIADREGALVRFRRTRDVARASGVKYWVFGDQGEPTTWVEFVEAPDADSLRSTLRQLELADADDTILSEVELD
ncbi:MAG: hypothetical protein ABI877_18315 [Gemmatimonadaceae bacterium]